MSNETSLNTSLDPNGAIGSQFTHYANEDIATRQRNEAAHAQAQFVAGMMRAINLKLGAGGTTESETALLKGLRHVLSSIQDTQVGSKSETTHESVRFQDGKIESRVETTAQNAPESDHDFLNRIRQSAASGGKNKDRRVLHDDYSEFLNQYVSMTGNAVMDLYGMPVEQQMAVVSLLMTEYDYHMRIQQDQEERARLHSNQVLERAYKAAELIELDRRSRQEDQRREERAERKAEKEEKKEERKEKEKDRHIPQEDARMRFKFPRPSPYGDQY